MLCDRSLSFFHSICHSVNRITDERGNGRRPILAGTGKRWPSRSGWLLVVIQICAWIPVFHFLPHWGIGHFLTFVSTYLFSQFSCNQQMIWTKLGEMNDADECFHNFGTDIRRTTGSRLIRKLHLNPDHFRLKFWRRKRFTLSITDKTSLISKIQNVWSDRFSKRRRLCSIEKGISDICCFRGVILSPYNCS